MSDLSEETVGIMNQASGFSSETRLFELDT
ncbi:MAG: hypothetical protein JWM42_1586, partial [Burkholderia sp.]|nr:hypothetical protein [Burkholderia sp.]